MFSLCSVIQNSGRSLEGNSSNLAPIIDLIFSVLQIQPQGHLQNFQNGCIDCLALMIKVSLIETHFDLTPQSLSSIPTLFDSLLLRILNFLSSKTISVSFQVSLLYVIISLSKMLPSLSLKFLLNFIFGTFFKLFHESEDKTVKAAFLQVIIVSIHLL